MTLRERLFDRLARELVGRLHLAPSLCGYRYVRRVPESAYESETLDPETIGTGDLPCNVADRDALPRESSKWGFSFHDVPERRIAATKIVTVRDCRVVIAPDEWGDPHYAILSGDRQVQARGTGFDRRLHRSLLGQHAGQHIARAAWILEQWDRNYSHWLQWHLVKVVLLREQRAGLPFIVPGRLSKPAGRSLELLGARQEDTIPISSSIVDVDELTFVAMDDYRPSLLRALRDAIVRDPDPKRKIYISREKAERRHLREEASCWELLQQRGYERVFMEDLSFDDQLELMREAAVLVTPHGTGMANMIFAPPGLQVVEIADAGFPNPQFYALAAALGHPYWLVRGRPLGTQPPGYNDITVDVRDLSDVIDCVEDIEATRP